MDICKGSCESFGKLMYISADLLRPYGVHVLHPDYKVFCFSLFITTTQIMCYFSLTMFTLYEATDFIEIAFCLTTFGQYLQVFLTIKPSLFLINIFILLITQGVFKIWLHIAFRPWMIDMPKQFHDLYTRCLEDPSYKKILDDHVGYCWMAFKVIKITYFSTGLFMVIRPALQRMFQDLRTLPLQVFLPYLDPSSFPGYELHYFYHSMFLILAISGFSFSDTYFVSLMVMARAHLKVIMEMLLDLDKVLHEDLENRYDQEQRLKRIVKEQQKHIQ